MGAAIILAAAAISTGCSRGQTAGGDGHDHEGHDHGEESAPELYQSQIETVGIRLGDFSTVPMGDGVKAVGELEVDPSSMAEITPLSGGVVKAVCVTEGQRITAGTVVARIENPELLSMQNELADARTQLGLARSELERQERLAAAGAGVGKNLERARAEAAMAASLVESLEARLRMAGVSGRDGIAEVRSPIGGVVSDVSVRIGSPVSPSAPMMTVTDPHGIFASLRVYERDLPHIRPGDLVTLTLTNSGASLSGTVERVGAAVDAATKAIPVRVALHAPADAGLVPGMAVGAVIHDEVEEVRALPEEAVARIEGRDFIFVTDGLERDRGEYLYQFKPVEVKLGRRADGFVEVTPLSTVPPEASVVVAKAFYIASMMADHGEHSH